MAQLYRETQRKLDPESVLRVALEFVRERRPKLLIENGGRVDLKLTWATKMVRRVHHAIKYGLVDQAPANVTGNNTNNNTNGNGAYESYMQ